MENARGGVDDVHRGKHRLDRLTGAAFDRGDIFIADLLEQLGGRNSLDLRRILDLRYVLAVFVVINV